MKYISSMFVFLLAGTATLPAATREEIHREFGKTTERELHVIVDVAFGNLTLERLQGNAIATVDYDESEDDDHKIVVSYELHDGKGTLRVRLKKPSSFWHDEESDHDTHNRRITVRLTKDLPIFLNVELGAGKGEIDLTNLRVADLSISTGASSVSVRCDQPNPVSAQDIVIETGVSKFTASDLSNMNFRSLKFSGGVGSYKLDFGGSLRQKADVKVDVGLGSVIVNVPPKVPARLYYDESWLSSFDLDDRFEKKEDGLYETADYQTDGIGMSIRIESGLGSVKVRSH